MLLLPSFAQEEIIKGMEITDMYTLHILSKQISRVVKAATRQMGQFRIKVGYVDNFGITFKKGQHGRQIAQFRTDQNLEQSYNYAKHVLKFLAEGFDIFNVSLTYFYNWDEVFTPERLANDFLPFLTSFPLRLHKMSVSFNVEHPDESIKSILKQCRNATELNLSARSSPEFQMDPAELGQLHLEELILTGGFWVTVDHILNCFMTCETVELTHPVLDADRLPLIVEEWQEGCRLENLLIGYQSDVHPFRTIFPNIEDQAEKAYISERDEWDDRDHLQDYFIIHQENGTEALVGLKQGFFTFAKFVITTNFQILP